MFRKYVLPYLVLFTVLCSLTFAQGVKDSKGTDFWVTFMPNYHNPDFPDLDSLYIFISSETPTSGTINYTDFNGTQFQQNFVISDVSTVHKFAVHYDNFELRGFNQSGSSFSQNHQNEVAAPQTFHIVSDNEVTVYGFNQASLTSDAFLVLPTDVLGQEYYVLAYPSDGKTQFFGPLDQTQSTPSQFVIVATEDNTDIDITLSTNRSYRTNSKQITTTLQRGQAYLVQAFISRTQLNDDLTGTNIISSKPIAVFAGHQRATVPSNGSGNSRDHLCEQMPPYDKWGNTAFVVPFIPGTNQSLTARDRYVVLSGEDNNVIYRNNIPAFTLNKGERREFDLINPESLKGTFPILVAAFKKQSSDGFSDPLMMIIPPAEQFLKSYRWINAQVDNIFTEQFTTIVAPNASIPSIKVDNQPIIGNFIPIPTTNYSYITLRLSDGVHDVTADRRIGIYVYGYGVTDSYGYTGGMQLLNQFKPVISIFPEQISAKSGDTTSVGILLDSLFPTSPTIAQADIAKAHIIASVNATVATPQFSFQRGEIRFGRHYFDIEIPIVRNTQTKTILQNLSMIVGLGDAEVSDIRIDSVVWLTQDNDTIWSETTTKSGTITVADVWKDNAGSRLINPQEVRIGLILTNNVIDNQLIYTYKNIIITEPTSVEIININGVIVTNDNGNLSATSGSNGINVSNLPVGRYYIRLSNGRNIVVREFSIVR
ncbi:MAG: T9SS type A sorting domain-containing protein [Candidatus Kapabacteria bacterium]|nr:T9SS type A sorting domain-containing protein [Candidatus Kapabacteria bacterium]